MSELQSSPTHEKPAIDALFPDLKRPTPSTRTPRFMSDALAASSLLGTGPKSRPLPPPPVIRSKSAPPPAPSKSMQLEVLEDAALVADTPITPTYDADIDDGPTVLRSSPMLPPLSARPQIAPPSARGRQVASPPPSRTQPSLSKPKSSPPPPPSLRAAPPPSAAKLPPLPAPPPSVRSNAKPASVPKLPPLPAPPSTLKNLAPPSAPAASAPKTSSPMVDDEAPTTAPPPVETLRTRDSVAPAAQLVASASSNRYVPPSTPPRSVRPLSALETIPASRYHSLTPQVLSQSAPPPAMEPRKSRLGWVIAAAAALGACSIAGFFALGGVQALGLGSSGSGTLAVTAAGPGNAALDGVRVMIDGAEACSTSPCELPQLAAGTHFVSVEAKGFAPTAARAVSIERGAAATLHVELVPEQPAQAAAEAPKAAEEPAKVEAPKAEARKAETPAAVTETAPVAKSSTSEARPARSERATKTNKETAEKPSAKSEAPKKEAAASATPAAMATLNINSIPVANVVLDGRPMGSTPLIGVSVSPGSHSVVFIHPELGRKASGTTVKAGGSATVAVRF